ncbi:MAG: hypothetical protein ACPL3C_06460 [Pyrobaculum sp.]
MASADLRLGGEEVVLLPLRVARRLGVSGEVVRLGRRKVVVAKMPRSGVVRILTPRLAMAVLYYTTRFEEWRVYGEYPPTVALDGEVEKLAYVNLELARNLIAQLPAEYIDKVVRAVKRFSFKLLVSLAEIKRYERIISASTPDQMYFATVFLLYPVVALFPHHAARFLCNILREVKK